MAFYCSIEADADSSEHQAGPCAADGRYRKPPFSAIIGSFRRRIGLFSQIVCSVNFKSITNFLSEKSNAVNLVLHQNAARGYFIFQYCWRFSPERFAFPLRDFQKVRHFGHNVTIGAEERHASLTGRW